MPQAYRWMLFALLALAQPAQAQQNKAPPPSMLTAGSVQIEPVAGGLEHPWALQFLPDGRMIVTERPGRLRLIDPKTKAMATIDGVPAVAATGQGGLLDVALAPDFAASGLIYLSYAEPRGAGTAGTAVARAVLKGTKLEGHTVVFRQTPATGGGLHFGSRIVFAPDGTLFITVGERYQADRAQDLKTHFGKVVRIMPDGRAPPDNPRWSEAGAQPEIWSFGHRNPQAAALNPISGKLWTVEHGARGGDEINIPLAGKNYGWPLITYGVNYNGARIGGGSKAEGLEQPVYFWDPSIAPSGMAFYTGKRMPAWTGNLFVGALAGQHLTRLVLQGDRIIAEERLLASLGERIRDVRQGPDEALYVVTDHPQGQILRVTMK